jgi:hypothetical protein
MSESSQNSRPVILWISMRPGATDRADGSADTPPGCSPRHHDAPPAATGPVARPPRPPGVFISYSLLQVLAILAGGGVAGLLITLQWPQAATVLGTTCAIIGAGLAVLDIMRWRDGKASSGRDQA